MERKIRISCRIELTGTDIEDVLWRMHHELLAADNAIEAEKGYGKGQEVAEKYRYWNRENEGDVQFSIVNRPHSFMEIENILV